MNVKHTHTLTHSLTHAHTHARMHARTHSLTHSLHTHMHTYTQARTHTHTWAELPVSHGLFPARMQVVKMPFCQNLSPFGLYLNRASKSQATHSSQGGLIQKKKESQKTSVASTSGHTKSTPGAVGRTCWRPLYPRKARCAVIAAATLASCSLARAARKLLAKPQACHVRTAH